MHIKSHHLLLPSPRTNRGNALTQFLATNSLSFNPCHSSGIPLSKISRLPQERLLIACSSLKLFILRMTSNFPVYQFAVTCTPSLTIPPQLEHLPNNVLQFVVDFRRIFPTQATLKTVNLHIEDYLCEKLLGINFDYKLNYAKHIEDISHKASRRLNTLARLAPYMTSSKKHSNECFLQVTI